VFHEFDIFPYWVFLEFVAFLNFSFFISFFFLFDIFIFRYFSQALIRIRSESQRLVSMSFSASLLFLFLPYCLAIASFFPTLLNNRNLKNLYCFLTS
jgi:hypothetical protein